MIQRQQNVGEPIPPFFIRTATELEASVNDAQSKDAKKKMNATNARALTATKQKVKKILKDFEKEVKQYQAVGDWFMELKTHCLTSYSPGP
jgi:translation initiation factor 3 subunit C